ncbi:MAG: RNA polymerase sigma factor [Lachnospiraceae bacterium]
MKGTEYNACVDKYLKMVYRIAFHYVGRQEDAEDIAQDVFYKLYSSEVSRENDEAVKAWLIRVTINTCHSHFRNPFLKRRIDLEEYEWEQIPDSSSCEQDNIERRAVMDAVLSLPENYRILIYLYYYEDYSCKRIAEILGIKETTVQTRLARARIKLKDMLSDSFPEKGVYDGV